MASPASRKASAAAASGPGLARLRWRASSTTSTSSPRARCVSITDAATPRSRRRAVGARFPYNVSRIRSWVTVAVTLRAQKPGAHQAVEAVLHPLPTGVQVVGEDVELVEVDVAEHGDGAAQWRLAVLAERDHPFE